MKSLRDGIFLPRKFSGRKGVPYKPQSLHPNTINDIVSTAVEVCALVKSDGLSVHSPPKKPTIAGTKAPADRDSRGRYLSFSETSTLIEACGRPRMRDLLLLDLVVQFRRRP